MSEPSAAKSLSVVVPVFNEADNVLPLLAEIHGALEPLGANFEVVFVDDGSRDETGQRLKEARAKYSRLRVVRHKRNCGQSTAIWTGVKAARGHFVATLDGDGQNDPADIARLIAAAQSHKGPAPLVAGIRRRRHDSWLKRVSSRIANAVRSRLLKDETPDTGCSLKLFEREAFLRLPFFNHMHRFLPALFRRQGCEVVLVDVNHRPRERGQSKYGVGNRLWVGIVDLMGVLWLQRRATNPEIASED
ncbi:MAG: glycosyltransferase family 2 protein [Alphaproteobacteria bacterium]